MSEAVKRGRAIGACRSSSSGDTDITWTSGSTARTAARIAAAVSASGALVRTAIDCAATMQLLCRHVQAPAAARVSSR